MSYQLEVPFSKGRAVVQYNGKDWEVCTNETLYTNISWPRIVCFGVYCVNDANFLLRFGYIDDMREYSLTNAMLKDLGVNEGDEFSLEVNYHRNSSSVNYLIIYVNGSKVPNTSIAHVVTNTIITLNSKVRDFYGTPFNNNSAQRSPLLLPVLGKWSIHGLPLTDKQEALLPAQTVAEGFQLTESSQVLVNLDTSALNENQAIKSVALVANARMNRRSPRNGTGNIKPVIGDTVLTPVATPQQMKSDMTLTSIRADLYVPDDAALSIQELSVLDVGLDIQINNE